MGDRNSDGKINNRSSHLQQTSTVKNYCRNRLLSYMKALSPSASEAHSEHEQWLLHLTSHPRAPHVTTSDKSDAN